MDLKKPMQKINKIYGPPGTGKTFRLIRRVKAYERKGVPLHKIGYFAFTRKAAEEARKSCLLYTSPSPRDRQKSRMPSSA